MEAFASYLWNYQSATQLAFIASVHWLRLVTDGSIGPRTESGFRDQRTANEFIVKIQYLVYLYRRECCPSVWHIVLSNFE